MSGRLFEESNEAPAWMNHKPVTKEGEKRDSVAHTHAKKAAKIASSLLYDLSILTHSSFPSAFVI